MKIALIVQRFPHGGAESYVEQIAQRLHKHDDVIVITSEQGKGNQDYPFPIIRLSSYFSIGEYSFWRGLNSVLKREKFDLVHLNTYGYFHSDYGVYLKKKYGYKTVFTSHGFEGTELHLLKQNKIIKKASPFDFFRPFYDRYIGAKTLQNSDHLIAISKRNLELYKQANVSESKISIIPPGVKQSFFLPPKDEQEKVRTSLGADPILITVGELSWIKAKDLPIRAMPTILKSKPKAKLFVIGKDRTELANLVKLSRDLGVEQNVLFLGFKSDDELRSLMHSADLLLHTSLAEGLSTILLESMACGLPFVTTPAGGNGYLAEETGAGVATPFGDEKILAGTVMQLLDDKNKMKQLASNGRAHSNEYEWDRVFAKIDRIYHNLVDESH